MKNTYQRNTWPINIFKKLNFTYNQIYHIIINDKLFFPPIVEMLQVTFILDIINKLLTKFYTKETEESIIKDLKVLPTISVDLEVKSNLIKEILKTGL